MAFRLASVRRNVADNMRRSFSIPVDVQDDDILALTCELSFMDGDELTEYLREEYQRLGSWGEVVNRNLSLTVL